MLRSPFSGVPYELACAYVAVAEREGPLTHLLKHERLAAGGDSRDAVLAFSTSLRELAERGEDDAAVARIVQERFRFDPGADVPDDRRPADGDFALREAREPESGTPLRAQNLRFSASQLNAYVECPRKWFYRYLCAAVEDKGSSASFYGTAFHGALEELHREYPRPGDVGAAELQRKIEGYVNASFDIFRFRFGSAVEYELQRRRAQRTARKYVEWLLAEAKRAPFSVIGCELSAELELEGYRFIGYIDRLDRDDRSGSITVIDYKTGIIAESAAQYRDKIRRFKDFQLPFYYWARTEAGDRVSRLALVPLKDALLDVEPIALEVVPLAVDPSKSSSATGVIPVIELERARTRMIEICRELSEGSIVAFAVAEDPAACTYCAYANACIERPAPAEERFGR